MKGNEARLIRLGAIEEKRKEMEILDIKIDRLVKDIGYALFMDDGIKSVDIDAAEIHIRDLRGKIDRYKQLEMEIKNLEDQ